MMFRRRLKRRTTSPAEKNRQAGFRRAYIERLEDRLPFNCASLSSALLFQITDTAGQSITSVNLGTTFHLRVSVPTDVFAAYTDIVYPSTMADVDGPILRQKYNQGTDLTKFSPGLLDDIGGFLGPADLLPPNGGGLLFAVPIKPTQPGTIQFTGLAPGRPPFTNLSVFNCDNSVPPNRVQWGEASIYVNGPPSLANPGNKSINEKTQLSFTISATDQDIVGGVPDTVSYTIASGALPGMQLGSTTGAFSWTPTEGQDGTFAVVFRATDNRGAKSDQTVTLTVNESNTAPVLANPGAKSVDEKSPLTFPLTATDTDVVNGQPNAITYSIVSGNASGMSLNSSTGIFNWTPTEIQDGKHVVIFRANDGKINAAVNQTVTVTVKDINEPPAVNSPANQSVNESQTLAFTLAAADADVSGGIPDAITFSVVSGLKPGMLFASATGAFSWTPSETQDGQHNVVFRASDRAGASREFTQTITVQEINGIPLLDHPGNKSLNENTEMSFSLSAADSDVVAGVSETLSYLLVTGNQPGMTLESSSGVFRWAPTESQDGRFTVVFRAKDSHELLSLEQTVTIDVQEINSPPTLTNPSNYSVSENNELSFGLIASDPDLVDGLPNSFTYALLSGAPTGSSFDSQTGVFRWLPTESLEGKLVVVFRAKDHLGLVSSDQSITITVNEVNSPPAISPLAPQSVNENSLLQFAVTAVDPDMVSGIADTVQYSLVSGTQTGMAFDSASGSFHWTPTEEQDGTYTVVFRAQDSRGLSSADESVAITVGEVNDPPQLTDPGDRTVKELESLTLTLSASDPDVVAGSPNAITYSIVAGVLDGMTLDVASGVFHWTPNIGQSGEHAVTFRADDGRGGRQDQLITITVLVGNHPPLELVVSNEAVDENVLGAVIGEVVASDIDAGQSHTFSVSDDRFEILNGILQLKANAQLDFEERSSEVIAITVTDSGLPPLSLTRTFALTVRDINEAPYAISLSASGVKENVAGAIIGSITASDQDAGQAHIFSTTDPRLEIIGNVIRFKRDTFADLDEGPTVQFEITATDNGAPPSAQSKTIVLDVLRNATAWQNDALPFDTNADGSVVPQDALRVINQLNDRTIVDEDGRLPQARPVTTDPPYYDTNGDGFCTPLDVLRIINFLNRLSPIAEGESSVFVSPTVSAAIVFPVQLLSAPPEPQVMRPPRSRSGFDDAERAIDIRPQLADCSGNEIAISSEMEFELELVIEELAEYIFRSEIVAVAVERN